MISNIINNIGVFEKPIDDTFFKKYKFYVSESVKLDFNIPTVDFKVGYNGIVLEDAFIDIKANQNMVLYVHVYDGTCGNIYQTSVRAGTERMGFIAGFNIREFVPVKQGIFI